MTILPASAADSARFRPEAVARRLLAPDWTPTPPVRTLRLEAPPVLAPDGSLLSVDGVTLKVRNPDGSPRWELSVGQDVHPPVADADGQVYAATRSGRVICLDGRSGALRWEKKYACVSHPPVLAGNRTVGLIVSDSGTRIANLDARDGRQRFSRDLPMFILSRPPAGGPEGNLYVFNSNDFRLHCFAPDGRNLWTAPIGDYAGAVSVGQDGTVLVPRMFGDVLALEPRQGKTLWSQRHGTSTPYAAPDGQGGAFVAAGNRLLHLEGSQGDTLWSTELPGPAASQPVQDGRGDLYLTTGEGVVAVDPEAGDPRALFRPSPSQGPPAGLPGQGVVAAEPGGLVHELSVEDAPVEPAAAHRVEVQGNRVKVGAVSLPVRRVP
ncbi:MAG: PQQ-binding-like beta-propeller repeat protein [Candidatus Eremiobacterota bacterium]